MSESMFVQAVGLARSGRKNEARDLFQEVLKKDKTNEMAWLWYAECVETPEERLRALKTCIRFNPQAQRVRLSLSAILNGNPPSTDPGLTQPVEIKDQEKTQKNTLTPDDEWVLSAGSAVFTVPPERIAPDEFARIEESTTAFLIKNPDMKPVYRRREDWSELSSRPAAPFLEDPKDGQLDKKKNGNRASRGAIFTLLLVALMFMLLASAAIVLRML